MFLPRAHRLWLIGMTVLCQSYPAPARTFATLFGFGTTADASGRPAIGGGVVYCTTQQGGAYSLGSVVALTPPASSGGAWTAAQLWSFGGSGDGASPRTGLVIAKSGVLYGTTFGGGIGPNGGYGTIFSLTPPPSPGGSWTEAVIWTFGLNGADGIYPNSSLAEAKDGSLYGTTYEGGTFGAGTVFSLTPPTAPGGPWTENVIWNFGGAPWHGAYPNSVVIDANGVLYGSTYAGGSTQLGTVFSLTPPSQPGAAWKESLLYLGSKRSGQPLSVVLGNAGVLYFPTNRNAIWSLSPPSPPSHKWTSREIVSLFCRRHRCPDGSGLNPLLYEVKTGKLFGTAGGGGGHRDGTLFVMIPSSSGSWSFKRVHSFFPNNGYSPSSGLISDSGGTLYGVTTTTAYSIAP